MLKFGSSVTRKVLDYFFSHPEAQNFAQELVSMLDIDPGNLNRKLKEFTHEGLLISETRGNLKLYRLNQNYSLLQEIQKMYLAKYGLVERLKEILSKVAGIQDAYIFGSYARNTMQQESDIDLLIIGTHKALEAKRGIIPLQKTFAREFNIIDMSPKEFYKKKTEKDPLIMEIMNGPVIRVI